jgi:hypothetical protein
MEVTSAASEEVAAMKAAASDFMKPHFGMVKAVKVRLAWSVAIAAQQRAKDVRPHLAEVRGQLDERLAELEAEGTWYFHPWQTEHPSEAVQALRDLGVVTAFGLPADPDPMIILLPPRHSELEPLPASLLNAEVEAIAIANATKLGRSGRDERHLFIWVDDVHPLWTVFDSASLMDDTWDLPPRDVPNLPPEITTAWAATEEFDTVVWNVRPPEPWEEVFRGPR